MPAPADIEADINTLSQFQKTMSTRRETARKAAEALLKPPASTIA
jgi:hypothetical protein